MGFWSPASCPAHLPPAAAQSTWPRGLALGLSQRFPNTRANLDYRQGALSQGPYVGYNRRWASLQRDAGSQGFPEAPLPRPEGRQGVRLGAGGGGKEGGAPLGSWGQQGDPGRGVRAHRAHGGILALGEVEEIDLATSTHPHGGAAGLMEKHRVRLRQAEVNPVLSCAA